MDLLVRTLLTMLFGPGFACSVGNLAYWPEEVPRVCRVLDLVARGARGHGPVHLLLASAAEIGFAWDGDEHGWLGVALPPLRMLVLFSIFVLLFCRPGSSLSLLSSLRGRVFGEWSLLTSRALYNYLPLLTRER